MSEVIESFGRRANRVENVPELLQLEREYERAPQFAGLDSLVGQLLVHALRGQRLATITRDDVGVNLVAIERLSVEQREYVDNVFALDQQQARGAWFLPANTSLRVGLTNLPALFRQYDRFAGNIGAEERGNVMLASSADAVLIWAIFEPLFSTMFLPFELRGHLAGKKSREEFLKNWAEVDVLLDILGFSVSSELAVFRYRGGWSKLTAEAQFEAKHRLLTGLGHQADCAMGARYRAYRVRPLVSQYYKKAKVDGRVPRRRALTRSLERTLAGFFGGDWLAFLSYLGEEPHPDEQVVTALPQTRVYVGGGSRAAEIAAKQGVSVGEVKRIAAAYWNQSEGRSPVEQRVEVLAQYWSVFDEIHTRQASGMKPLWGLVEDYRSTGVDDGLQTPYQPRLYTELLPVELLSQIEALWGTAMLPRWPERIVCEPFSHVLMTDTLGPALGLWHGCALTAWFLCEGPYSRTDMSGLAHYHRREISALEDLVAPVDLRLFDELVNAEAHLPPPQPIYRDVSSSNVVNGISVSLSIGSGSRRDGFESLRDIITRHRREWTQKYFAHYIRARWESEIREAGRAFNVLLYEKGKQPSLKQFAKPAAKATNHWFGGDVSRLYAAIQEKSPVHPSHRCLMPSDRVRFVRSVFGKLGGTAIQWKSVVSSSEEQQAQAREREIQRNLSQLAEMSLWYVQLEEALGRPPEVREFGAGKLGTPAKH